MKRNIGWFKAFAMLLLLLQVTGCAQIQMGAPRASLENLQKIRSTGTAPLAAGDFAVDPAKGAQFDRGIPLRGGNSVSSPVDGSFAKYLRARLVAELQGAGAYDPASVLVVKGVLTQSDVETVGTGKAVLAARFSLEKAGTACYEKELRVETTWDTSFIAAIAVPAAANGYEGLYQKLVGKLFDDPDFRQALMH